MIRMCHKKECAVRSRLSWYSPEVSKITARAPRRLKLCIKVHKSLRTRPECENVQARHMYMGMEQS